MLPNIFCGEHSPWSAATSLLLVFLPVDQAEPLSTWAFLLAFPWLEAPVQPVCLPLSLDFDASKGCAMSSLSTVPPHTRTITCVCHSSSVSAVPPPPSFVLSNVSTVSPFRLYVLCGSWPSEVSPRQSTVTKSKCQGIHAPVASAWGSDNPVSKLQH